VLFYQEIGLLSHFPITGDVVMVVAGIKMIGIGDLDKR